MFFAWAHVFFFPFHKPNYYECAFFLAKPTTHARVVRHTILKRNGKKKPWAQTNNSLPNNHVRHNEASFNSTKWRCPYDNVTYCKFTPNRKQLPKQLPPPLHMARTWMDMHRLRRLHDSQYIMKNPFTNENSNLSNIFHNNIHRKKVESLKVRSTEEFLCQFAWLPCRFFRGRRQGRQPLLETCEGTLPKSTRSAYSWIYAVHPTKWHPFFHLCFVLVNDCLGISEIRFLRGQYFWTNDNWPKIPNRRWMDLAVSNPVRLASKTLQSGAPTGDCLGINADVCPNKNNCLNIIE